MELKVFHCRPCLEFINSLDASLMVLYVELCQYYCKNGAYSLDMSLEPYLIKIVRDLEKNGYLVSMDIERNIILVKPLGHRINGEDHFFCSKKDHSQ